MVGVVADVVAVAIFDGREGESKGGVECEKWGAEVGCEVEVVVDWFGGVGLGVVGVV